MRSAGRVRLPAADTRPRLGIVHLGIGAFHRAHQAVFTEDAMEATGEQSWGICGVTQRSRSVVEQLAPQGGLYGVLQRDSDEMQLRIVAAVRKVFFAGDDPQLLTDTIADPDIAVATLTVTEKGYRRAGNGGLDLHDPGVQADLAGAAPTTAVGRLVRGLQRRAQRHQAGITVLSCDNLAGNGAVLARLIDDFCAALPSSEGDVLRPWIATNVRFPPSMVDRIVPATSPRDFCDARELTGLDDAGLVVAEPFRQWVIQDTFAGPRPAWERAGALLVDDVEPYETAKLRLLNATHSLLAYAGALAGHTTIADAVHDPALAAAAEHFMVEDATPTLRLPPGFDAEQYRASVLRRLANPALRHTTTQVAMDGSQKLPIRLLGVVRDRLAHGAEPMWASFAVAAWMLYVARSCGDPQRYPLQDPMAARLQQAAAGPTSGLAQRMLDLSEVFDHELADSDVFADLLAEHIRKLDRDSPA
jgi:fructuronate reductase